MKNSVEEARERKALAFSIKRIKDCMEPSGTQIDDPITTLAALYFFQNPSSGHQVCWNDRFCAAVACELDWRKQQLSAWCAVSNGLWSYWEIVTHSDLYTDCILENLGIPISNHWKKPAYYKKGTMYYQISPEIARALIEKFDLPTTSMNVRLTLTKEEKLLRDAFNNTYSRFYEKIL